MFPYDISRENQGQKRRKCFAKISKNLFVLTVRQILTSTQLQMNEWGLIVSNPHYHRCQFDVLIFCRVIDSLVEKFVRFELLHVCTGTANTVSIHTGPADKGAKQVDTV